MQAATDHTRRVGDAPVAGAPPARPARCGPGTLAADLRVALLRTARRLRAEKSAADLGDGQYAVLALLAGHGTLTPRELADAERVQPPTMTRALAALADRGLVERTEHPTDGRQVLVTLTAAGAATVRETRRRRDAWLARRLAALPAADREVLARAAEILRRIADT